MLLLALQAATLLGLVSLFAYMRADRAAAPLPGGIAPREPAGVLPQRHYLFESELRTYEDIWASLVEVQAATEQLRPAVEQIQIRDESIRDARDRKRLADFAAVFNGYSAFVQQRRPFFPPAIYAELQRLMQLAHGEAIDVTRVREQQNPEYWTSARENADAITQQVDRICEVIRDRLQLTSGR